MLESKRSHRLLILLILPVALVSATIYLGQVLYFDKIVKKQSEIYAVSAASRIADHLARFVIEEDLLSLNVLVARIATGAPITSLAVYDSQHRLVAQVGRVQRRERTFTQEITFQDSMVGHITLTLNSATTSSTAVPVSIALFVMCYAFILWRNSNDILLWVNKASKPKALEDANLSSQRILSDHQEQNIPEPDSMVSYILVVKIRPTRYVKAHQKVLNAAVSMYEGTLDHATTEELVAQFDTNDALFKAICCGLLLRKLMHMLPGQKTFGGAINSIDLVSEGGSATNRKNASYLASIAEGALLVCPSDSEIEQLTFRVSLEQYHHSLIDREDLLLVVATANQVSINAQADILLTD